MWTIYFRFFLYCQAKLYENQEEENGRFFFFIILRKSLHQKKKEKEEQINLNKEKKGLIGHKTTT